MIVGVDPGVRGALALLDDDGALAALFDMPTARIKGRERVDPHGITRLVVELGHVSRFVVERVTPAATGSRLAAFTFGWGCGELHGVLVALDRAVVSVPPKVWLSAYSLDGDKGAHRRAAADAFPSWGDSFARARDDGRADAALIGLWGLWKGTP